MNKTEMAQKLAKQTGLTQSAAQDVVDAIFSTESGEGIIAVELDAGNKVTISGFGTFATKSRAARKYAHFSPAKGLKERVSA